MAAPMSFLAWPTSAYFTGPVCPPLPYFLSIASDNRVKLWDVVSGGLRQTFAEPNHLAAQYTCVAYASLAPKASKKSKAAAQESAAGLGVAAIGTQTGAVIVWDLSTGNILHRLGGRVSDSQTATPDAGHVVPVTDVKFSADGATLYSSSQDKTVCIWNVRTGELVSRYRAGKHIPSQLCVKQGAVFAASSSIRLIELTSGDSARKYSGHSSPVTAMSCSQDGAYFASAASLDRFVNLWDASLEGTNKRPLHSFPVSGVPTSLQLSLVSEGSDDESKSSVYELLAVSDNSVANVWRFAVEGESVTVIGTTEISVQLSNKQKRATAAVTPDEGAVLTGVFIPRSESSAAAELMLVRGSALHPVFQRVTYTEESGTMKSLIKMAPLTQRLLTADGTSQVSEAPRKRKQASEVVVTDSSEAPIAAPKQGLSSDGGVDGGAIAIGSADESKTKRKKAKPAALASDAAAADDDSTEDAAMSQPLDGSAPSSGSLQVVLSQALRSNDDAMLEFVLNHHASDLIKKTVDRLPATDIVTFLQRVISKFQSKPSRGLQLLPWIQECLYRHTAYLISLPNLSQTLAPFYHTVDSRLTVFKKLLTLSGRLDLMLSQIALKNTSKMNQNSSAVTVIEEDDS